MTEITTGAGGVLADWGAAIIWLQGIDPLGDDYRFPQVGHCTVAAWGGLGLLDMNFHTVSFYNPYGSGFITYIDNGVEMGIRDVNGGADRYEDIFTFDGLNVERIDAAINPIGIKIHAWNVGFGTTGIIKNCTWKGNGSDRTIYINDNATQLNISNCKIANVNNAFRIVNKNNLNRTIIEDVSVDNCNQGGAYFDLNNLAATFRSVSITNGNVSWQASLSELYNCADDDGSMIASGATLVNPQSNITPANEFQSTDRTNANWLKLIKGTFVSPNRYTGGALQLGRTGIKPTLAGTEIDIERFKRPGPDGAYSIGAHELQYITIRTKYHNFILDAGAVYMNFISQDEPGILLGATRGGNVFTIKQEIRDMVIDGAKGLVKGSRRFVRVNAKLTCNFIEHTLALWQLGLPGSETTSLPGHIELSRNLAITDNDYIDNIVIIAQVSTTGQTVVCGVKNALADGNFEMGTEDSNERGLQITFTAHFDKLTLDEEPWILMYPEEVTTSTTTAGP